MSSANIYGVQSVTDGRSLTYTRNKSGPSTNPCRAPLGIGAKSEFWPLLSVLKKYLIPVQEISKYATTAQLTQMQVVQYCIKGLSEV